MAACLPLSLRRSNSRRNFICEEQDKDKNVDASIERTGGGGGYEDLYSLSIPKKLIRRVKGQLMKRVGLIPSRVRRDGLLTSVLVCMERVFTAKLGLR